MTRTKNPQPTSTYSDSSRESTLRIPNFILVGPPQPICEAKPLRSRHAKMKHVAPVRRSSCNVWNSATKNKSGTDPNALIDLEKEEEVPSQATNQSVASKKGAEKPHSSSKKDKNKKKVEEKHEMSDVKESGNKKEEIVKGKQSQGVKRKQPDMHYLNKKAIVNVTDYSPGKGQLPPPGQAPLTSTIPAQLQTVSQLLDILECRSQGIIQQEMADMAQVAAAWQQPVELVPQSPPETAISHRRRLPASYEFLPTDSPPELVPRRKHRGKPPTSLTSSSSGSPISSDIPSSNSSSPVPSYQRLQAAKFRSPWKKLPS